MTHTLQLIAGLMFIAILVVAVVGIRTAANAAEHNNVTIIHKSDQLWPVKGLMTMNSCDYRVCTEI